MATVRVTVHLVWWVTQDLRPSHRVRCRADLLHLHARALSQAEAQRCRPLTAHLSRAQPMGSLHAEALMRRRRTLRSAQQTLWAEARRPRVLLRSQHRHAVAAYAQRALPRPRLRRVVVSARQQAATQRVRTTRHITAVTRRARHPEAVTRRAVVTLAHQAGRAHRRARHEAEDNITEK